MSILDVTEDQIFQTLGKGKDPNFKPIEKIRPAAVTKPKKTYSSKQNINTAPVIKNTQPAEPVIQPVTEVHPSQKDDSIIKLTNDFNELNERVSGLQKMVKWYIVPQFVVIMVLILVVVVKFNS